MVDSNRKRLVAVMAIVIVLVIGAAISPLGSRAAYAQALPDWTVPYRPAMPPAFAGDMVAYADAPRYTLAMTLARGADETMITGHETVRYTNRAPGSALDQVVFRLYPNLPSYGAAMTVENVQVNGAPVEAALDATRSVLSVPLVDPLETGAQVVIDMDYAIRITPGYVGVYVQFSDADGVLALPNAYPVLSVYEPGRGWWQITDHPQGDAVLSETAFFDVQVTAPHDLILAASGSEVDLVANDDGTLTHCYVAPLMRDFALMASTNYVTLRGEQDGVTITLYYDPEQPQSFSSTQAGLDASISARAGLEIVRDAVRIFNASFGPYPFTELDVVQTPTTAGGIEYPGLFVITTSAWNKDVDFFEFVLVHEASHEWWYSLVGNDQTLHPWMDEALAQYAVAVYIREHEGVDAYHAALASYRAQVEQFTADQPDQTIGGPVTAYPNGAYFFMVYQKGPLFFGALEATYGYDRLIDALQAYLAAYRYQIAEPDDMQRSFEATLGTDLTPIFAEWVGNVPVG